MERLKLVLVDDEPILLEGLKETYDWDMLGFTVVGTAQSGEQAIEVIERKRPHVVLTDIRMKQMSGLMMMEEVQKRGISCLFIVLSAYRDFEYAQAACSLGAFAYLLKPIEEEKLYETMKTAYRTCKEQIEQEEKQESWKKLMQEDSTSFLQVVVQRYLQNAIPYEKVEEVFAMVQYVVEKEERFITICSDLDISYKIINKLDYEAKRYSFNQYLGETISQHYFCWKFENQDNHYIFVVKIRDNAAVKALKRILEDTKAKQNIPVIAAISKPYKGIAGMKKSYEEALGMYELASVAKIEAFADENDVEEIEAEEGVPELYMEEEESLFVNAVRKNDLKELKQAFVHFIYVLPKDEVMQLQYLHKMMLQIEFMVRDSYGMSGEIETMLLDYYSNLQKLDAVRAVDVSYKILGCMIEERKKCVENKETNSFSEYMSEAIAYIDAHLGDEDLSVVSVANHVYLNPVYFGRVFKQTFQQTFKQYLLSKRMERAKKLIRKGNDSIAEICDKVGISNPSYFSHLFKQYTGVLPSEYKKEMES